MSTLAWKQLQNTVANKNILIFGLGVQGGGVGVANTLVAAGANVRATDLKDERSLAASLAELRPEISGTYGSHRAEDIDWAEIIVKNPGVPTDHPLLTQAKQQGKTVTTEVALSLKIIRDRCIGITGTRGKTTTTTLIHHLLTENGVSAVLCGNIPGHPLIATLESAPEDAWFVVEISSFQLESLMEQKISPHIAVATNVFPDHLNRYASLEAYAQVKAAIFTSQRAGDKAFWGTQHEWEHLFASSIVQGVEACPITVARIHEARSFPSLLPGEHNVHNVALAMAVARSLELPNEGLLAALASFPGVPFRLEEVAERNGITYVNDTTSTTPVALEKALDAQLENFILICGGTTKQLPFSPELLEKLATLPKAVVFLTGSGTTELQAALSTRNLTSTENSLVAAVQKAESFAAELGVHRILFSPGFSSFELFANEFDRGDQFTNLAKRTL